MDPVPNWLSDAVAAAGMTAYADDLYPKVAKESASTADLPAEPGSPLR